MNRQTFRRLLIKRDCQRPQPNSSVTGEKKQLTVPLTADVRKKKTDQHWKTSPTTIVRTAATGALTGAPHFRPKRRAGSSSSSEKSAVL
jgi:hypothetical protein